MKRVAVVIVSYNSKAYLSGCLDSLMRQTRRPDRVLVLDNASTDGSLDGIAERYPEVELIPLETNIGFAAANNLGVSQAEDCDGIFLLNPDTVADPDCLEALLRVAGEHPECAGFGCRLTALGRPDRMDGTGDVYHVSGLAWRRDHGRRVELACRESGEIFSPCAAAALYRRAAFLEVGGFDPEYFAYFEDVDLAFRLRLRGYRLYYAAEASVAHAGWGSSDPAGDFSLYHGHRNLVWTFVKNMPAPLFWRYLPEHLLMNLATLFWFAVRGRGVALCRAKWDAVRHLKRALRQRRVIQGDVRVMPEVLRTGMVRDWRAVFQKMNRG